ncbi:MAG: pyrimidine 5'-nucleotidase [Pseudomonadota bacterium]
MKITTFSQVDTWVFDLDNTLYHPSVRLFDQIEARMRRYIMDLLSVEEAEADALRATYWRDHGTTLSGLMAHHKIDPMHFLFDVHDLDFSALTPDAALAQAISALPGRKIVFTNGDAHYARRVLAGRGLAEVFEDVYGIEHAAFAPKPRQEAFDTVFSLANVAPTRAAMFEDDVRNLMVPKALGLGTVLVHGDRAGHGHIDHDTQDLATFLTQIA